MTAREVIESLKLERHPEGGWFRRTFESSSKISTPHGERPLGSSIYYLLAGKEYSAWHHLRSDETWFFHAGCGLLVHMFGVDGYVSQTLGPKISLGAEPQLTIPAQTTFAAELCNVGEWCLIGCSVFPGFDFDDFAWGDIDGLCESFPEQTELLLRLGRR